MAQTTYCPSHPDTPTNLRCSRCDKLFCPRCMVHSPVGVRCQECGKGKRLPTYDVSGSLLARAIPVSLGVGLAGGLVIALIGRPLLGFYLQIAAMAGFGYLLAEADSLAANRKRGRALQYAAFAGIGAAYAVLVVTSIYYYETIGLFDLIGAGIASYVAYVRLR